jgi:predicted ATP-grasp superfamily ATP-dependent carboligase
MLAAVRSLTRRGIEVSVGSNQFRGMGYSSRYVARRYLYPHPGADPAPFVERLRAILEQEQHDVLLPMNDYTMIALAHEGGALAGLTRMALPPAATVLRAHDKYGLTMLARELGIETPETRLAEEREALPAAVAEVGYPCVVKYRRGSGAVGLRMLEGPVDWDEWGAPERPSDLGFDSANLLVQERVPGITHDVCAICHEGELRVAMTQARVRTYPFEGGMAVEVVTTKEPDLVERAAALLRALRWHGPAQVEFKVDAATGRRWLIEVNGRLWGGLGMAIHAGLDFTWLWSQMAMEGDIEPRWDYRVGARYRWPAPLGLLHIAQAPRKAEAVWSLFGPARDAGGDWWWSDPVPVLAEVGYALRRMWGRKRLGAGRAAVVTGRGSK